MCKAVSVDTTNLGIGFDDGSDFFRWLYYAKHISYTEYMQSEENIQKALYKEYSNLVN